MPRYGPQYGPDITFLGVDRCDLDELTPDSDVDVVILGAPFDGGTSNRPGTRFGPMAIRMTDYLPHDGSRPSLALRTDALQDLKVADAGDVEMPPGDIITSLGVLEAAVEKVVRAGAIPVVLGGDHSIALGTLGGLARVHGSTGGVLWIDAHGDLNTPASSPSGNVHGMPLAAALGMAGEQFESDGWTIPAVTPERVALVGIRSLDDGERRRIRDLGVRIYTMSDVDRIGIERAIRESLDHIAGPGFVHVSLDMDALDPEVAPGVGTPVRGGLSYREAHLALELVAESGLAGSFEVVEVNPILDRENATAQLAVELVASALGKTIF